ncbi:murein L,D-transpeptidase YcbB/YkuD [Anseongella ginsenosidimutans]|uniref:Murein L,D-transpeptidase YcbB/YkuD n=1 Tax=Anseongella ginsenosidimutans TaxID=496056 RepID=A0A4R3KTJ9_9SPHI|nr:L,D-transpeptidase family protein [Anseongella ginsenosidimutans]TCS88280.1 murein L,D-transpeptidase YcbB/YkuD [Anseongella ginsenosidimutans]
MKNTHSYFTIFLLLAVSFTSCRKSEQDIGTVLFREFRNPVLKETGPAEIAPYLERMLREKKLKHGKLIAAFYQGRGYSPVLLKKYLPGEGLGTLIGYLEKAGEHGLNPALFQPGQIRRLQDSLSNEESVSTPEAAAPLVAELELQVAASLAAYGNALQFGFTNPADIFPRYYIETTRPDSTSLTKMFAASDLEALLDSIQPTGNAYKALQDALAGSGTGKTHLAGAGDNKETENTDTPGTAASDHSAPADKDSSGAGEVRRRALLANLERLRWKNKPEKEKYVLVNIADFRLHVVENGVPGLNMKVCVGEPAKRWQTPQLNSLIERVQVNPIWHIPESIASNEIIEKAAADPYYLENSNIDVYKNGEIVADSREIDWESVSQEDLPYSFKQRPGSQNALGKIKFLFDNQSSVYLHDTPAKAAFDQDMRAVSHGCVRVEKPLELAHALFGNGNKFEMIKTEMGRDNPEARNIELSQQVPVYLVYATCWLDNEGNIQYRPDVYGLDKIVVSHLQAEDNGPPPSR